MKLLQNSKYCVRVQLTREDMDRFCVTPEDFDSDSDKTREVILKLCEIIGKNSDFPLSYDKIYIQLYPKSDGSCELFFIRVDSEEEGDFFLFRSFDHFYSALAYLEEGKKDCICYRMEHFDRFLVKIPSEKVVPQFWEYGEKLKDTPSREFLNSKCLRIASF